MKVAKWILGIMSLIFINISYDYSIKSSLVFLIAAIFFIPPTFNLIMSKLNLDKYFSGQKNAIQISSGFIFFLLGILLMENSPLAIEKDIAADRLRDSIELVKIQKADEAIQAEKEKISEAIKVFKSGIKDFSYRMYQDEFQPEVSFFYPPKAPKYTNVNWLYPYFVFSGSTIGARYRIQYEADDWLFINSVQIKITNQDNSTDIIDFYSGSFKRDNNSRIWEWADFELPAKMYLDLHQISSAKTAKIRFNGLNYHKERLMTNNEKSSIASFLKIYEQYIAATMD